MTHHTKVFSGSISAITEVARLQVINKVLLDALEEMLEMVDVPPDRNCSCHISGPCHDCVEYSGLREARKSVESAIAKARGVA